MASGEVGRQSKDRSVAKEREERQPVSRARYRGALGQSINRFRVNESRKLYMGNAIKMEHESPYIAGRTTKVCCCTRLEDW